MMIWPSFWIGIGGLSVQASFKNLYVALSFRPQLFFETKTAQKPYSLGPHIDSTLESPFWT